MEILSFLIGTLLYLFLAYTLYYAFMTIIGKHPKSTLIDTLVNILLIAYLADLFKRD